MSNRIRIRSVMLAAGRGERLRPLSDLVPKPCLPVLGLPLGLWPLSSLVRHAPPVVVNASHLHERLISCLGIADSPAVDAFVEKPAALGTAGTLRALVDRLGPRVVVYNGDLLSDLDLSLLIETHERLGAAATLAVKDVGSRADFEVEGDRVVGFVDRRRDDRSGVVFLGVGVYERSALDQLPSGVPSGLGEVLLRPLAESGCLAVHVHPGYARDVGTVERYLQANLDVLAGAIRTPTPIPGEIIEVPGGRAFLGEGARTDDGGLRAGAIVLPGAEVSRGARVERAIVWPGETVPPGETLSNAVWVGGRQVEPQPEV